MSIDRRHDVQRLADDVRRFKDILLQLTQRKEGLNSMPPSELHFCAGLAFLHTTKAGAGLSFEHGHGFVISKLKSDVVGGPGPHRRPGSASGTQLSWDWSAPLFITANAASIGVTLGYSELDSIVILDTAEAVHSFTGTVVEVDTDLTGAAGPTAASTHLPATAAVLTDNKLSSREFTYSLASGVMVDVSLTGLAYSVDSSRNEKFYGDFASPAAILEGGMQPPAPMQELYAALDGVLKDLYEEQTAEQLVPQETAGGHRVTVESMSAGEHEA